MITTADKLNILVLAFSTFSVLFFIFVAFAWYKGHGHEPQSKIWKQIASKLRGIMPSAARDCSQ